MNDEFAPKGQFSSMNPVDFGLFFLVGPCGTLIPGGSQWSLRYEAWSSATASLLVVKSVAEWFLVPYTITDTFRRFMNSNFGLWLVIQKKIKHGPVPKPSHGPNFRPPQMVAGADTVGTQKGTPWNAWWNGENWALRQVWPIIQTPGYIYIYTYIYILNYLDWFWYPQRRYFFFHANLLFFWIGWYILFVARSRDVYPENDLSGDHFTNLISIIDPWVFKNGWCR